MASSEFFSLFSSAFLALLVGVAADEPGTPCPDLYCDSMGPPIRFPFRIKALQDKRCGYPGFEISCDGQGRAILHLPHSGDLVVNSIDYPGQLVSLGDPDGCLLKRLLATRSFSTDLGSASSPFLAEAPVDYTVANCTRHLPTYLPETEITHVACLDRADRMVVIAPADNEVDSILFSYYCDTRTVLVPGPLTLGENGIKGVGLKWDSPDCRVCERNGGRCVLESGNGSSEVQCATTQGAAKQGATFVLLLITIFPALLCILGGACYLSNRANRFCHRSRNGDDDMNLSQPDDAGNTQHAADGAMGIDSATLESYPKAQIDDPGRAPRPNDNVCAICLSEYQPKEMLRTIPGCAHYFHAHCVDQWLKRNASCPLCRNRKASSL
ncbi:hypothetical protein BT93_E0665 [Corymbia citriodora subsp. variegata]|nr:hypothetical protein BT93_E0665 [Corymbia citriodora subsp. variegata]